MGKRSSGDILCKSQSLGSVKTGIWAQKKEHGALRPCGNTRAADPNKLKLGTNLENEPPQKLKMKSSRCRHSPSDETESCRSLSQQKCCYCKSPNVPSHLKIIQKNKSEHCDLVRKVCFYIYRTALLC